MLIIDDYLSLSEHKLVKNTMLDQTWFPWFYLPSKTRQGVAAGGHDEKYNFQFIHPFYSDFNFVSQHAKMLQPFIDRLKPRAIVRIKANLSPCTDTIIKFDNHIDVPDFIGKTAIYYVNSNNGKTVFADGTKVDSKENRMVIFDSHLAHSGTTCTDEKVRCVINFNYIEKISS